MNFNKITQKRFMQGFALIVRLCLGCMFLYISLQKIRQPYDFLSNVYNYELVGPKLGLLVAMVIPWAELFVGICLIGGIFVSGALLVSIAMGAMFSFAAASALYRGLNISCGFFSASSTEQIGYTTLIRTLLIMFLSMAAYISVVIPRAQYEPPKSTIPM